MVTPADATRPMSGKVMKPSASTRYLPVRSGSSKTVIVSRSSGPTDYRGAVAWTGGASGLSAAGFCGATTAGGFGVCAPTTCGTSVMPTSHVAMTILFISFSNLLRDSRQRNSELARFPVQIRTLNAERLSGGGHLPAVVLEDRRNVVALETKTRFAQLPGRLERRRRAVEPEHRQQIFDLNQAVAAVGRDAVDHVAKLREVAGPGKRGKQG